MRRRTLAVSTILVAVTLGCSGDSGELDAMAAERDELAEWLSAVGDQLETLQAERDELAESLTLAEDQSAASALQVSELEAQLADLDARQRELQGQFDAAIARTGELEAALEVAEAAEEAAAEALEAIRVRFDPEIQQAVAAAQAIISDEACAAAEANGFDPSTNPAPNIDLLIDREMVGLPEGTVIDRDAIASRVGECRAQGEARAAQAALTSPKGDGLWTVGVEIAAGRWRSSGTGDSCYWKRSPDGEPDDIIDNHFGNAGGTVTLRDGEEFETDDCGTWEYLG